MKNKIIILKDGYSFISNTGDNKADCSISLIIGTSKRILVDTGLPLDRDYLIKALKDNGLNVEDVDVVVGTHGHSDHISNIGLFPHSLIIVSCDICHGDTYYDNELVKGIVYPVDEGIDVMFTPGHTGRDVSVVVRHTEHGTVVVAGDLFESEQDIENSSRWKSVSENPDVQLKSRSQVAEIADCVVPGHGPMFTLTQNHKEIIRQQMCSSN